MPPLQLWLGRVVGERIPATNLHGGLTFSKWLAYALQSATYVPGPQRGDAPIRGQLGGTNMRWLRSFVCKVIGHTFKRVPGKGLECKVCGRRRRLKRPLIFASVIRELEERK